MKKLIVFFLLFKVYTYNSADITNLLSDLKEFNVSYIHVDDKNIKEISFKKINSIKDDLMKLLHENDILFYSSLDYRNDLFNIKLEVDKKGNLITTDKEKHIINNAKSLLGYKSLNIKGVKFNWDCSGTVLASYFKSGIDLKKPYTNYNGNGVTRLNSFALKEKIEYKNKLPRPSDFIFWDNTYDKNGDKKWNDYLTHIGIVIDVNIKTGLITYLHHDYIKGIVIAYMNLEKPNQMYDDDKKTIINSPLRMRKDIYLNPSKTLSSHLFRSFGRII